MDTLHPDPAEIIAQHERQDALITAIGVTGMAVEVAIMAVPEDTGLLHAIAAEAPTLVPASIALVAIGVGRHYWHRFQESRQ
jgi:hypothetical protein